MFGKSQGSEEETVSFQWKNLKSHIQKLCLALPIVFQRRSKWPPPPLHFDIEQGNWTLRGYLDQGKVTSAASAGVGGGDEGALGVEHVEEAEHAGAVARRAQCCDGSDTNYCFWLKIQQA